MSFPQTIILDALGNPYTFSEVSSDSTGSIRIDTSTDISTPRLLAVKHAVQRTKGGPVTDRHLVQVSLTKLDTSGQAHTAYRNGTDIVPRNGLFSVADIQLLDEIEYQLRSGGTPAWDNLAALLRGER